MNSLNSFPIRLSEGLGTQSIDLRWHFEFGVRISIPLLDRSTLGAERVLFEALTEEYDLSPGDSGREFWIGQARFRVAGIDPRLPKDPIFTMRVPDGKGDEFTAQTMALRLSAAMKYV